MTAQEIRTLPIDEKVRMMAAIWEDMRDHYEEALVSDEVIDSLKERQARVVRGEAQLLDWDQVKSIYDGALKGLRLPSTKSRSNNDGYDVGSG